jgi:FAD/FMN-containing dehydrogenase/Fe-S oxidoreductase
VDLRRLQDDLHGFFKGEILFDDIARLLYSTDASIFQVKPAGVVAPRDEEDVCGLVRYAQEQGIALIARGAGTGLAGESLGTGLIIDLSKHFRDIVEVGADSVRVQPGVTYAALNARLAQVGRRFAPDPSSGDVCTIGGMLANNASGARAIKYGYTRDHVLSLRAILDNGDAATVARNALPQSGTDAPSHLNDIMTTLGVLLEQNRALIATTRPRTRFDRLGYHLEGVLDGDTLDLPRLLVGSEGTLAFFTEATLRTLPLPAGRAVVLVNVASLERAIQAVQRVLATGPSACELLDRRLLSLTRVNEAGPGGLVSPAAEAVLLIEYETESAGEARRRAEDLKERLASDSSVIRTTVAIEQREQQAIWQIREVALPSLYGMRGGAQPIAYIEDVGVPVEALNEYLRRVQDIMQEHETTASFLVHAGAGQVHTRPFLDMQKPADVSRLWSIADKVHALALELGGTVSSQHGTGLARTPWVARQYGPLYPILRQVKAIFDPKNIFNPGKIVDPDPNLARPLRQTNFMDQTAIPLSLVWQPDAVKTEASHCNGCGQCRTEAPQQRMCPIFRATHTEAATPRAKANLLRELLQTQTNGLQLSAEEVRTVADLCVNCKMCAIECPAHVNIPKLMLEAKAANVKEHGMDASEWFFSRMEGVLGWGSAVAFMANLALRSRTARWLLSRFFGVAASRRLPRFAARSFLARAKRRGWTRKPTGIRPVVVYFVDLYANYIDPQIAEAAVAVLQHQGFEVFVPADQRGSGIEALAHGDVETTREIAQQNLRVLVEAARAGWPIVCSEPSAALMLKHDYLDLQNDDDARAVAERTIELMAFLGQLHQQGRLRTDFGPLRISVGHHVPCHVKALTAGIAGPGLLALIPELRTQTIDVGCSGMAGTFGMKSANYELSRQAGGAMLAELRRPQNLFGSSECSSCRMQMEDGAEKRTLHPVQYLALAYGLIPEVADRLREPLRELVLR